MLQQIDNQQIDELLKTMKSLANLSEVKDNWSPTLLSRYPEFCRGQLNVDESNLQFIVEASQINKLEPLLLAGHQVPPMQRMSAYQFSSGEDKGMQVQYLIFYEKLNDYLQLILEQQLTTVQQFPTQQLYEFRISDELEVVARPRSKSTQNFRRNSPFEDDSSSSDSGEKIPIKRNEMSTTTKKMKNLEPQTPK